MGGTELKMALTEVCSIRGARDRSDILLITDGDIWDIWYSVRNARNSNHRIFAIGVGSAPAESLLRQLALDTGGACELVSPTEDMKPAVMRMLHRIRSRRTQSLSIDWGHKPAWVTQLPQSLFAGDTIHVFAGFNEPAHELKATLTCQFESNAAPVAGTPHSPRKTTETEEASPTLQITSSALPAEAPHVAEQHNRAIHVVPSEGVVATHPRMALWATTTPTPNAAAAKASTMMIHVRAGLCRKSRSSRRRAKCQTRPSAAAVINTAKLPQWLW
jgi:hypothetical protein